MTTDRSRSPLSVFSSVAQDSVTTRIVQRIIASLTDTPALWTRAHDATKGHVIRHTEADVFVWVGDELESALVAESLNALWSEPYWQMPASDCIALHQAVDAALAKIDAATIAARISAVDKALQILAGARA